MNLSDLESCAAKAVELLKAIANEKRLMIVCALYEKEKSVSELEKVVGLSQSALSQHLARLRRDNIVTTRRNAQTIHYSLSDRATRTLLSALYEIFAPKENLIFGERTSDLPPR